MVLAKLRAALACALLLASIAVALYVCSLLLAVTVTVAAVPDEIRETRAALIERVAELRIDALAEIDSQANALRADGMARIDTGLKDANANLVELNSNTALALAAITGKVDAQLSKANESLANVAAIRTDLQPVLASVPPAIGAAQALVKDAQDSWDQNYDDVQNLVQSAEVATTQTAQTMEAVAKAAPVIGESAASIAKSGAQEAKALTAPQTLRQKIMVWLELIPRIAIKVL